ncbi:hypothetical protein FRC12_001046, partial [Ceratobasidium sp. 428]
SDGSVDLYSVLEVSSTATGDDIKTAYRKLALKHHPDKHAAASEEAKASASATFQQIGFAYAVLSDTARRKRYDATGSADPGIEDLAEGEDAWERYFQEMFDTVTRERLDEMRRAYQGSDEERSDLRAAYLAGNGSIEDIMDAIPHSTYEDEVRLVALVNDMIGAGELQQLPTWTAAVKNIKAQNARQKKGEKEAKEAEEAARELGVWDEFYGSGKVGKRKGKGKGATASNGDPEGEDHSALKALIQSKAKKMDGFLDSLAEKYASASKPGSKGAAGRGRKRSAPTEEPGEEEEQMGRPSKRRGKAKEGVDDNASKASRGRSAKGKTAKV